MNKLHKDTLKKNLIKNPYIEDDIDDSFTNSIPPRVTIR